MQKGIIIMQEAKALFQKLKIRSLLDLALLTPSSYSSSILSTELKEGEVQTFEAVVGEVKTSNGKLYVVFDLPNLSRELSSIFFRVTPYHYNLFIVGSHHYIQGRVSSFRGELQMSQPKSLKRVGEIIPKYSTPIKEGLVKELIEYYITEENLYAEGLDSREVSVLMKLHYPKNREDIEEIDEDALKFIEAFNHIKKLKGKRYDFPAMESLNGNIERFISNLPFSLTHEQKYVIDEVKRDLNQKEKATKRLIIGDVGSGKTMIILASAMIAYPQKSIL
ncbi:MAG TPA: ATP-dependent DNA helicase RecG, partial [Campylobacterales bacterium]|nr:ATP-dependent DNA helicase RecG [Campylobacterales bacterium]